MNKQLYIYVLAVSGLLCSCSGEKEEAAEKEGVETVLPSAPNEVTVMTLKKRMFEHELVSNGKVKAGTYADLRFRTASEPVYKIYVKNGERVKKGQKLAELDRFTLENKLAQAKNRLDQATLEMQDVVIGQGYAPDNLKAVPEEILQLARVKSGYEQSKADYELARYELEQAVLTAPFDGVVANLFDKEYNRPKDAEVFCRIISTSAMEVDFTVLESELPLIRQGDKVDITPYAATAASCSGSLTEINPLVDEDGLVRVKARVDGGSRLFDGMNVRVSVKRSVPDLLVIPKTALVLRSGRQVVFTLDEEGRARWNYVRTGLENMTEYSVTGDGMEEGVKVIVTGNVNLAHEAPVKVVTEVGAAAE